MSVRRFRDRRAAVGIIWFLGMTLPLFLFGMFIAENISRTILANSEATAAAISAVNAGVLPEANETTLQPGSTTVSGTGGPEGENATSDCGEPDENAACRSAAMLADRMRFGTARNLGDIEAAVTADENTVTVRLHYGVADNSVFYQAITAVFGGSAGQLWDGDTTPFVVEVVGQVCVPGAEGSTGGECQRPGVTTGG